MPIIMRLDRVMADRKVSSIELAERIGKSPVNLSRIKTGRSHSIRFDTLDGLCRELHCQPGDLMEYVPADQLEDMFGGLDNPVARRAVESGKRYKNASSEADPEAASE